MKWSEHWADFKRLFNILTLILALYGIGLTILFYYKSQQHREISYRIVSRTKVYDSSSNSPKLQLLARDKTPITNDVFVASFQFWNSGTLPIELSDVRRPLSLELVKGDSLLDWTIAYCLHDPDVCKFSISAAQTDKPTSTLHLSWEHFDLGRGCQIQVLFMGDMNTAIGFESPFSGNGEMKDVNSTNTKRRTAFLAICGSTILIYILVLVGADTIENRTKGRLRSARLVGLATILMFAVLVIDWFIGIPTPNPFPPDVPVSFKADSPTRQVGPPSAPANMTIQ